MSQPFPFGAAFSVPFGSPAMPVCGARTRTGGACQRVPLKGGNGRCTRHGGPAQARLYRERQIADVKAGRMSLADWERAEARRAANRLQYVWKRNPWAPGSTIALAAQDEDALRADVWACRAGPAGAGLPPIDAMPPAVADWLRWRWRRFRVDQDRPDRWREVLAGAALRERLAKAGPPPVPDAPDAPDAAAVAAVHPGRGPDVPDAAPTSGPYGKGSDAPDAPVASDAPSAAALAALGSISTRAAALGAAAGVAPDVPARIWHGGAPAAGSGRLRADQPRQPPQVRGMGYGAPGRPRSGPPAHDEALALQGVLARMRPTLGPMLARLGDAGAGEDARWRLLRAARALEEAPDADVASGRAATLWLRHLAALGLR